MSKFDNYITEEQELNDNMVSIIEFVAFIEDYDYITEGKISDLGAKVKNEILPKLGLTLHKKDNIFTILGKSSKWVSQMIYHAFLAYYNNSDFHKEKVKELKSKVKKADIMDILVRLDHATLHIISEPIHIIDVLTGWELQGDLSKLGAQIDTKVKQAIQSLDSLATSVTTDAKKTISKYSNAIRRMFSVGKFVKVGRDV